MSQKQSQAKQPQQQENDSPWSEFEEWGGESWFAPCSCSTNKETCPMHGRK